MIGQKLNDRYSITSRLGEGGMGEVFQAVDEQSGQQVAVKVLARQLSLHAESLTRFRREAETLRQLEHPNIVKFLDAFEHEEQYVIVMEYIAGGSLHDLLRQEPLPIDQAKRIALELCDALIRSHHLNIIHRDIKPENVLLLQNGTPRLADFGVARLSASTRMTSTGTKVGTPHYMSPEAWKGETIDAQADIWSFGVMLFEMLAGRVPFDGDTEYTVMTRVCTTPPPNLKRLRADVPPALVKIVNRMLTRDKKRRYQTMRQVAVDLESGQQVTTSISHKFRIGAMIFTGLLLALFAGNYLIKNLAAVSAESTKTTSQPQISTTPAFQTATPVPLTFTATPGTGSTMIGADGMILVFVPAGEFIMGSDEYPDAQASTITLDSYWMDQTEVTNKMYAQCVSDGTCQPPLNQSSETRGIYFDNPEFNNHPVIYVDWNMAQTYCESVDRRLPTEAEWEKAARATNGRVYPWGNTTPNENLLNFNNDIGDTTEVGKYPEGVSFYGALDMAGNVWEWVSSVYEPYPYDANDGRENLSSADVRGLRGGSWGYIDLDVHSAYRYGATPSYTGQSVGFRCALSQ